MKSLKILPLLVFTLLMHSNELCARQFEFQQSPDSSNRERLMEMARNFIAMMKEADPEKADVLARKVFDPGAAEGLAAQLKTEYGTIEKESIRIMPDEKSFHVVAWLKKLKAWRNFQIGISDEAPQLGIRLAIVLAAPPTELPAGTITDEEVLSALNEYMDLLAKEEGLTASVLISKGEEKLIDRVTGYANREKGRKNTAETPFNLASTGKLFTSVAVLRLVEQGKISLDDPVMKFLPDYPDKAFAQKVNVKHLLTHSSGLADYWDDEYEKHWGEISSLEQYLPFVTSKALHHRAPGSRGIYSNSGFILLGLIIEVVTGEDYYAHVQRTIFKPLRMERTGFYQMHQDDLIAVGYFDFAPGQGMPARGGLMGSSAGGAYSTAADLLKFRDALLNHELLSKEMFEEATTTQMKLDGGGVEYGLGFVVDGALKQGFGHGGQGPGSAVAFDVGKENGYTLVILSNSLNGAYSELLFTLRELFARK